MFRLRFADGGELQLTEAGSKKRAGVWLLRPDALAEELAHLVNVSGISNGGIPIRTAYISEEFSEVRPQHQPDV